ncbi:MAG: ABC transporter substrate-binding protein [Actinomycetota bacterium]|nr:ABC transporter substrate-binding protein [Actinomycetota bacterium]
MRIVSLLPSATEIVFALGRGDDLVGVTFECDHPPAARGRRIVSTSALPEGLTPAQIDTEVAARVSVGEDLYRLDQGALSDLRPELVLTQDLCAVCAVAVADVDSALDHLGCRAEVVTLDPSTLDDVIASIATVGAALGAEEEAAVLVAGLRARLDELRVVVGGLPRRRVLVLEWSDPPFSAGHWVPDLVEAAGGHAVLADPGADSRRRTWDDVAAAGAEVVVVAPCGYHLEPAAAMAEELLASGRIPAGAEVWAVDADAYVVRPGPRLVDGAELLGAVLHPEHLGAPDPARARRIA